jgi:predicted acylesterase/phospholipase RssA
MRDGAMTGRARSHPGETGGLAGPGAEKTVSLALQGGGAHGAFTWGVLDALLEDGRIAVEAIAGASAGAMNAVVMVEGWLEGGIDGARSALETFWRRVSVDGSLSLTQRGLLSRMLGFWSNSALTDVVALRSVPDEAAQYQSFAGRDRRAHQLRSRARLHGCRDLHQRDQCLDRQS